MTGKAGATGPLKDLAAWYFGTQTRKISAPAAQTGRSLHMVDASSRPAAGRSRLFAIGA